MICGRLQAPQDRSSGDSSQISIFVMQLPARRASDEIPIIYLAGGPGDSASADTAWWLNSSLRDARDIILIDQRGAGLSRPSLNCPEFDARDHDSLAKCRERLLASGINLSAYHAESIAQDIADLITAMELDQVNIYARSYGARLALLLAQKLPQSIRTMVLDSAYTGAESALESAAANTWRSMQLLLADCQANDPCSAAYPNLSTHFSQAAAALRAQPVKIDEILPNASLLLDGENFVFLLRDMLADANRLPHVPALIASVAEKDYGYLASTGSDPPTPESLRLDDHSEGLYFSALCADESALTSTAKIEARTVGLPPAFLPLAQSALSLLADCASWLDSGEVITIPPSPYGIPTLFLAGAYDPIAAEALQVSETPLVRRIAFPHVGHGVLEYESCAEAVAIAFWANPTKMPSHVCLQDLRPPVFHIRENE